MKIKFVEPNANDEHNSSRQNDRGCGERGHRANGHCDSIPNSRCYPRLDQFNTDTANQVAHDMLIGKYPLCDFNRHRHIT